MNRRNALKNMSLSLGCTIGTTTLLSILNSCNDIETNWEPKFLSDTQKHMIDFLVDFILPKSDSLGGLDLNLTQFIDKMIPNILEQKDQLLFNKGSLEFEKKFKSVYKKEITKGTKSEFHTLLKTYFKISKKEEELVFNQLELDFNDIPNQKKSTFLIYSFLTSVRYYSLFGYYTSKAILQNDMNYNANLGYYNACISL